MDAAQIAAMIADREAQAATIARYRDREEKFRDLHNSYQSDIEPTDEQISSAILETEYKYFGDYEFSDNQRNAVGVLVCAAIYFAKSRATIIAQAAELERLRAAAQALGAMPEGYCFCSKDRIGDDSKTHETECADLRAALEPKS